MSDIQDYIKHIIKKHETLSAIPPINVYINRMNNRLVFKIKDEYKLELQTPEAIKLFGGTKNYYNLYNYYRDEVNDNTNENNADNYRINNSKAITSKPFEFKETNSRAKLIGNTPNDILY